MNLGENLKTIREEAGLSFEDLSKETKIQEKYLKRLEAEEFEALPDIVYIKGYIKRWARACGADGDKLVLQFHRENEEMLEQASKNNRTESLKAPSFIITAKHVIAVVIILAIIALLSFFYFNQRLVSETPRIEVVYPADFNTVTEEESIIIRGEADNTKTIYINGEELQTGDSGGFSYTYSLNAGMNTVVIKAISTAGREVETARKILKL